MWWLWHVLLLMLWLHVTLTGGSACGVAELACRSGRCVPLDAYCDGVQQCGDGSDEPPHCTPCNRTYYGRAGRGYELELPAQPRLPFLCHLTFTAGGGAHGELVQLGFEEFHVGRYEAGALDGCPDGYVQLAELGRPFTGGSWCGEAAGAAVYYSETATVTLSLRLYRLRVGETFALRLRYKFLSARDAVVRFGLPAAPLERGAVSPGTYCTRTYEECHRRPCRLQSPNYPGMYPRNVTCYWSLRQKDIPTCKHAMISVRQEHAHKMQIKRSISMASLNKTGRAVRAWRECTGERDRLIVYDGGSTDDPVLLVYCGGDWLPPVTSRGPDMLVAFHSSPYSAPPRATAAAAPLRGFELDVVVVFADSDSLEYAREPRRCEFHVKASSDEGRGRRGLLHAPRHTLPPGTTCTWTFHGRPGDVVWIYFASYSQYSLVEPRAGREVVAERDDTGREGGEAITERGVGGALAGSDASPWARLRQLLRARPSPPTSTARPAAACSTSLRLWEGGGEDEPGAVLVGRYCDEAPALCARASLANATRAPRACAPPDGYVSRGTMLALAATSRPGTATHPLHFALHYEFVDARLPGEPLAGRRARPPECSREVKVEGEVGSPRNVLWFGRGGARRLRCILRLDAGSGKARAELRLMELGFGARERCSSRVDPRTGQLACSPHLDLPDDPDLEENPDSPEEDHDHDENDFESDVPLRVPHLRIYESPWPGYRVPLACICDNSSLGLVVAGSGALEVELVAPALSPREDARHVHWSGTWRRLPPIPCHARIAASPGGHVALSDVCEAPLLLMTRGNRSVFLRVWGEELPSAPLAIGDPPPCATANRVLVYDPYSARLLKAVCPGDKDESARTVQMFSGEWWGGRGTAGVGTPALAVVWTQLEPGAAWLAWMEAWRGGPALMTRLRAHLPDADNMTLAGVGGAGSGCSHVCPELEACADAALWCDGALDCPRGGDEAGACGAARLLAALREWRVAGWVGSLLGFLTALCVLLLLALRRRWAARTLHKHPLDAPPRRLTQEPLLDSRSPSASS